MVYLLKNGFFGGFTLFYHRKSTPKVILIVFRRLLFVNYLCIGNFYNNKFFTLKRPNDEKSIFCFSFINNSSDGYQQLQSQPQIGLSHERKYNTLRPEYPT